ncbi:MAG: DUF4255 domain-containing protein [Acidobacteriota bacterium]|nr:DUF4255 domain-containing protein [Acidobacteriota bacterium]
MSNSLAIAAVTAALRNLLTAGVTPDADLNDTTVTTQPPDRARANGNNANQLNIFLYQALPNAAWRNMDMPGRVTANETAMPPLALNLYYLVTAYGRDNDVAQPFSHELLGRAMIVLHDHAVLLNDDIRNALPNNDLYAQIERVRLTLQPLNVEEISKLWTGFQTQYRLSVAYEASVVLIESTRPVRAALPVLTRGPDDRGVSVQASLEPPFAEITSITAPSNQPGAQLGDTVTIAGGHLAGDIQVLFYSVRLPGPIRVAPQPGGTADQLQVVIDNTPAKWLAGTYTVSLEITENKGSPNENVRVTNGLPFAIVPAITTAFPINVVSTGGTVTINLACTPEARPEQRVALPLGGREVMATLIPAPTGHLRFVVTPAIPGSYPARLRVDGTDSLLVDRSGPKPVFKNQRVIIT